ncbi:MAG: AraC family transcriptional regulator [Eubacteriales bacterium]|nr:AraC family transcriptional regulator [Eubacteriales bacterium]
MQTRQASDFYPLLQQFHHATRLPITVFEQDIIQQKYAAVEQDFNLPMLLFASLTEPLPTVWQICTPEYLYFAGIRIPDSTRTICVGPTLLTDCSNRQALLITNRIGRKLNDMHTIQLYFDSVSPHTLDSIESAIQILCRLLQLDTDISIKHLAFHWSLPYSIKQYVSVDTETHYDGFDLEQRILSSIQQGDILEINRLYQEEILPLKTGNPRDLTQVKYFISNANMMASRLSIQNGVDTRRADAVSSHYHAEIISAKSMGDLTDCFFALILEYTKMNAELQELPSDSLLVHRVSQYTKSHISEKISTRVLADRFELSESYLSTHFKKETGMTISSYVQKEKIREAKKLLDGTAKTLAEISSILSFSSESYFCAIFKKITGMTPESYRHKR